MSKGRNGTLEEHVLSISNTAAVRVQFKKRHSAVYRPA